MRSWRAKGLYFFKQKSQNVQMTVGNSRTHQGPSARVLPSPTHPCPSAGGVIHSTDSSWTSCRERKCREAAVLGWEGRSQRQTPPKMPPCSGSTAQILMNGNLCLPLKQSTGTFPAQESVVSDPRAWHHHAPDQISPQSCVLYL